jgi:D-lactate dehydrogenase (cytochrome)
MTEGLIRPLTHDFDDFLRDESRRKGSAESISFPESEKEVIEIVRAVAASGSTITTQGARTGIVAGAVPQGGHVLNLSRMKRIGEVKCGSITVEPGATLDDIRAALAHSGMFFPPDPTETTASIGGMAASNASGAMSFHYGPTRAWVNALRIVLADGDTIAIRRGERFAQGRMFQLETESGRVISGELPDYSQPSVKLAAGYFSAPDMDLIDLFIGSEGTLGIITEIELRLIEQPGAVNGLTVFFASEEAAVKFVQVLRGEPVDGVEPIGAQPVAIEFFNHDALSLLRRMKSDYSAFDKIPALKPHFHTAINTEFHGASDEELEVAVMEVMEAITALGGSDDDTWFATTERELEPLHAFRHATPEAVNLLIDERRRETPELVKLGTDMSVPDAMLPAVLEMYNSDLGRESLESVIFGHIGANHVHVNILPRDMAEYDRGKSLYLAWAGRIVGMGGSVSAEHGIGKLKAPFLELMYGPEGIEQMRRLKFVFDPLSILNPGNLFG